MATKSAKKAARRSPAKREPRKPPMSRTGRLTDKQAMFVAEYLIDLNATQAAIRAGYSKHTAMQQGARLLLNVEVAAAIQAAMDARAKRTEIDADWVLKRLVKIVEADPHELVQYRRGACPSCWPIVTDDGDDLEDQPHGGALKRAKDASFVPTGDPNPNCASCHGHGDGRVWVADTRHMSDAAKAIYAGVKVGKDGLQVIMHDQPAALLNIAKHLGMFIEKREVDVKGVMNVSFNGAEADL